jgi:TPR repeat protein
MYEDGEAIFHGDNSKKKDEKRGRALIEVAAANGFPMAEAYCLSRGWCGMEEDDDRAFAQAKAIADETGYASALDFVGCCYMVGAGVEGGEEDEDEAVVWHREAAAEGNVQAMVNLGYCLENGVGVVRDVGKALEWYRKTAEQRGSARAMLELGRCFQEGVGVEKNAGKALEWYGRAAAGGVEEAKHWIREMERGRVVG